MGAACSSKSDALSPSAKPTTVFSLIKKKTKSEFAKKIVDKDGTIREGTFVNGKLEGYGRITQPNKDVYTGMLKNGLADG